jgi:hypothetical protein
MLQGCIILTVPNRVMGGCFGRRKLMKKPINRWTELGGMQQICPIHRPGRWQHRHHDPKAGQSATEKDKYMQVCSFFNLALEEVKWSASCFGCFTHWGKNSTH